MSNELRRSSRKLTIKVSSPAPAPIDPPPPSNKKQIMKIRMVSNPAPERPESPEVEHKDKRLCKTVEHQPDDYNLYRVVAVIDYVSEDGNKLVLGEEIKYSILRTKFDKVLANLMNRLRGKDILSINFDCHQCDDE